MKRELDSLLARFRYRRTLGKLSDTNRGRDSVAALLGTTAPLVDDVLDKRITAVNSTNVRRLSPLIRRHGYPGKSLVGTPTNEAAFYLSSRTPNRIGRYLPLIKQAARQGELTFRGYAKMLDRHLMNLGQKQLYGTQGQGLKAKDPATGQMEYTRIIGPIQDPATVNQRRREAGFDLTVEANTQRMGAFATGCLPWPK